MVRLLVVLAVLVAGFGARAEAFCGFFIDTGGASMFNDATQVVLMRDGTRTVLAMENNYAGPLQDFALVIPVPAVLHQGDVRTLPKSLFAKVNGMTAPRLVEYFEQDPCYKPEGSSVDARSFAKHSSIGEPVVTIEAQFDVDEYKVVILSAKDSTGLDSYLRGQHYKIPDGAAPLLRPYVEGGMKFFVAKVDPKKVHFEKGKAVLSPLRFFYDSDDFTLPIRLGLANSAGTQDLVIHILADNQRYEVANYPNEFIPTNIVVEPSVEQHFAEFYAALFDRTLQEHPGAVITEYSWGAQTCDPCPGPMLDDDDFKLLGEEVLHPLPAPPPPPPPPPPGPGEIEIDPGPGYSDIPVRELIVTRLHARYGTEGAARDSVFRKASPVTGGREPRFHKDKRTHGVTAAATNAFQGRYIIQHPWTEPIDCADPHPGYFRSTRGSRAAKAAATDTANAPRGHFALQDAIAQDIPEIAVLKGKPLVPPLPVPAARATAQGCGCRTTDAPGSLLVVVVVGGLMRYRRRHAAQDLPDHDGVGDGARGVS